MVIEAEAFIVYRPPRWLLGETWSSPSHPENEDPSSNLVPTAGGPSVAD